MTGHGEDDPTMSGVGQQPEDGNMKDDLETGSVGQQPEGGGGEDDPETDGVGHQQPEGLHVRKDLLYTKSNIRCLIEPPR